MDRFYNERAAIWARDLVMKMDEGTAREFITHVTREVLLEDIRKNQRVVNARVVEINKSLMQDMDRLVSKGLIAPTAVVAEIAKAWEEQGVKRDRGGRFATVEQRVRSVRNPKLRLNQRAQEQYGVPKPIDLANRGKEKGEKREVLRLKPEDEAAYHQQYLALADAMDTAVAHGGAGVTAILENKHTGQRHAINVTGSPAKITGWNPAQQNLVATRVRGPEGTPGQMAGFDLISSLTRSDAAGRAAQSGMTGFPSFAERWNTAGEDEAWNTNARTYRRIGAGSALLGSVATDPKLKAAAAFGQWAGQYGPEAEKVIGPSARKAAYRYRGTERKPDSKLVAARQGHLESIARERRMPPNALSDELKSEVTLREAVDYLDERKPNMRLSEIHLKSGKVPPSEGVMIGSDGKIKHQAIGHADDHYLPFDLTNLKDLRGGQYVRTRTTGGLTTEDIYTGLVSGARQVTVVSNSGVFTINFADDFRGVRRYNDKAASMVDRYAKTLDTLKEGKVERQPIDPKVRAQIRDEVTQEMPRSLDYSVDEIENEIKARIENYRENPHLTKDEIEEIENRAAGANMSDYDKRQWIASQTDRLLEERRSRLYKLDGEGYAAAMESLREQYPYYIQSVEYQHRRGGKNRAGEVQDPMHLSEKQEKLTDRSDSGYVMPRYNRPAQALEGYWNTEIAGVGNVEHINSRGEKVPTGKTRAHQADYQNWENNKLRGRAGKLQSVAEPETAEGETTAPQSQPKGKPVSIDQERKSVQAKLNVEKESLVHLNTALNMAKSNLDPAAFPQVAAAANDPDFMSDRSKRSALVKELEGVVTAGAEDPNPAMRAFAEKLAVPLKAMHAMENAGGGEYFDKKVHLGISPAVPYRFDGLGFGEHAAEGPSRDLVLKAVNKDLNEYGADVPWQSEDDAVLRQAAQKAGHISRLLAKGNVSPEAQQDVEDGTTFLGMPEVTRTLAFKQVREATATEADRKRLSGMFARVAENIEKKRRLLANAPAAPAAPEKIRQLPAGDTSEIDRALAESGVTNFRSGGPAS